LNTAHQTRYLELLRPDAVDGGDDATEHVVEAVVEAGALDGHHVERLLDHGDGVPVAIPIITDITDFGLSEVEALATRTYAGMQSPQGSAERRGLDWIAFEQMKGQALG